MLWSLQLSDGTTVARVTADSPAAAVKQRPRPFKAKEITARRVVHVECASPRLYRWFIAQCTPYVARLTHAPAQGFEVLDEERWAPLLSAAEGREIAAVSGDSH